MTTRKYVHIPEISWLLLGSPIGGVDFTQISEILITWNYAKRGFEVYPKYASYAV